MKVRVLAFGQGMPGWVQQGCEDYCKRMPAAYRPEFIELALKKRSTQSAMQKILLQEDKAMLSSIASNDHVVAMDVRGEQWSTEQLAEQMQGWQQRGKNVTLLVGGPEGLGEQSLARADRRWSLSRLTFPHALVRVLLAEQLYRAWSISAGRKYHR